MGKNKFVKWFLRLYILLVLIILLVNVYQGIRINFNENLDFEFAPSTFLVAIVFAAFSTLNLVAFIVFVKSKKNKKYILLALSEYIFIILVILFDILNLNIDSIFNFSNIISFAFIVMLLQLFFAIYLLRNVDKKD